MKKIIQSLLVFSMLLNFSLVSGESLENRSVEIATRSNPITQIVGKELVAHYGSGMHNNERWVALRHPI